MNNYNMEYCKMQEFNINGNKKISVQLVAKERNWD